MLAGEGSAVVTVRHASCGSSACSELIVIAQNKLWWVEGGTAMLRDAEQDAGVARVLDGATVEVATVDDESRIELADVRFDTHQSIGCSVAAVGARR